MTKKFTKTAVVCTAVLSLANSTEAANIVVNGDFSSNAAAFTDFPGYRGFGSNPEIESWTFTDLSGGNAGVNGSATSSNVFGPSDTTAATTYAFVQNGTALISQVLTLLVPDQEYSISFLAANRSGNPDATGRVQIGDSTTTFYSSGDQNFSTAAFELVSSTFTTPASFAGDPSIQLYSFTGGDNTVAYSNVMIEAIPEPSAAMLLGAAGLLLTVRRR